MKESVVEYLKLVVRSWWALVTVVAGVLVLASELTSLGIPRWIWWLAVGGALLLAQFEAFRHVREEREKFAAAGKLSDDPASGPIFTPRLFEGRLFPWQTYAVVGSNEKALVLRCAVAWAVQHEPSPITSDLQKHFEDEVAASAFEGWLQQEIGVYRGVSPEQCWKRVQPTNSRMITLARDPTPIDYYPFSIAAQCVLDLSPGRLPGSAGYVVTLASAVLRPRDSTEGDAYPQPFSVSGLYEALSIVEAALVDQIAPKVLKGLAEELHPISCAGLAIASAGELSEYVGLRFHGWPRAEGSYEPTAFPVRAGSEAAVIDPTLRDAEIKDWLRRLLSDAGYSEFERDVELLERPRLPVPIAR